MKSLFSDSFISSTVVCLSSRLSPECVSHSLSLFHFSTQVHRLTFNTEGRENCLNGSVSQRQQPRNPQMTKQTMSAYRGKAMAAFLVGCLMSFPLGVVCVCTGQVVVVTQTPLCLLKFSTRFGVSNSKINQGADSTN